LRIWIYIGVGIAAIAAALIYLKIK